MNVTLGSRRRDVTPRDGAHKATVLTGESPQAFNDIEHPNRVAPKKVELIFKNGVVDLPP